MSKIPNLSKALETFQEKPNEYIEQAIESLRKENSWEDFINMGAILARKILGESHGSDVYDNLDDQGIKEYLNITDSGSSDGEEFERWDYIEQMRAKFAENFFSSLTDEVFLDNRDFKHLYKKIITIEGLEGLSELDFAKAIKVSPVFRSEVTAWMLERNG